MECLLPVLTQMINISIETANVPVQLKEAMIRPKLKKESLVHEVYSNFRPISNLKCISKTIEKAVSYQLNYLRDNDLEESLQSSYKTFHCIETALVKFIMTLFLRLTISPILFYYSLTCLQLLTPATVFAINTKAKRESLRKNLVIHRVKSCRQVKE